MEDLAYASLLKQLAVDGIDCYLVHMPGNLAFMGMNRADKIMETYSYDHWYLAGHSLEGRWQPFMQIRTVKSWMD